MACERFTISLTLLMSRTFDSGSRPYRGGLEIVPEDPPAELWTGALEPRPDLEDAGGARNIFDRSLSLDDLDADLPVVSIGQPEVLRSVAGVETPGLVRLAPRDFYLVRLWCSFRPPDTKLYFQRASFKVALAPAGHDGLIAHDMHPKQVLHKIQREISVTLSPELTFMDVGAKLGSFDYGFTYPALQPSLVASGQGESTPSWVFSTVKGLRLEGGKAVHVVVAAPAGTPHGEATLDLVAHVTKPGLVPMPMGIFAKRGTAPAEPLKVQLW
jgi:hypothetical protein